MVTELVADQTSRLFSPQLREKVMLGIALLITIWIILATWASPLFSSATFDLVLMVLLIHLALLFVSIPTIAILGRHARLSVWLLSRFQMRAVEIFLLTEFAITQLMTLFTGVSDRNPTAAQLLAFTLGLMLIIWLVYYREPINTRDVAFVVSWSLIVLVTRGAIWSFMFVYQVAQPYIKPLGLMMAVLTTGVLIAILPLPLLLQHARTRARLVRLRNEYARRPARLYLYLAVGFICLLIVGMTLYPMNNAGLWLSLVVVAPILALLFTSQPIASSGGLAWNVSERAFRIGLGIIIVTFLIVAILSACKVMWTWFPDMYSYLRMAQDYARGDFVIRGYWSPLMPWLLAAPISLGIDPQVSQRFLNIGADIIIILLSVGLSRRFGISRLFQLSVAGMVALIFLQRSFYPATADVLAVVPTSAFFFLCLDPRLWRYPVRVGLLIGVTIALGYFSKHYNLPFMLGALIATLCLYILHGQSVKKAATIAVSSIAALVLIIAPWVFAISRRYGVFTYSTTSIIARITPPSGNLAQGCIDFFLCTEPKDVIFPWEDPLPKYYPGISWSPIASVADVKSQIETWNTSLLVMLDHFPLGSIVLLSLAALAVGIFRYWRNPQLRFLCSWLVVIIAIQTGGYIGTGYMVIFEQVEFRYHLTLVPLLAIAVFLVIQGATGYLKITPSRVARVVLITATLGIISSTISLPEIIGNIGTPQQMKTWVTTGLPRPFPCDRVAADAINDILIPPFASTDLVNVAMAFYTQKRSLGVLRWPGSLISPAIRSDFKTINVKPPSTVAEVDDELHDDGVKTFVVVNAPDLSDALVSQFHYKLVRSLTICEMPSTVLYPPDQQQIRYTF